jgi:hypothetical protein
MAVPSATEGAIKDVVSQFWNNDTATVALTKQRLLSAARPLTSFGGAAVGAVRPLPRVFPRACPPGLIRTCP